MSESFQLQEWEDSRGRVAIQPVPSPRQKEPVLLAIVCAFILISGANLLYTHTSNTNMKSILEKQKKVFQAQIKITDYNMHKVKMEIMLKLLTQKYFQNLERKMYSMESISELEEFHMPERQRILKEFETESSLNANSPLYKDLKAELESELDRVYIGLESESQDWNVTISKAYQQVRKVYSEERRRGILEYKGNDLISPEISIEFHEKMAHIAISKCLRQKLVPTSTGVVLELKLLLDQAYHKKIAENAVIGIDFGHNEARAAVYFQGKIQIIPHLDRSGEIFNSTACYVGVGTYDGYVGQCAQNILQTSLQLSPIVYDMKQIINTWSNFDTENKNRTFVCHDGGTDGPVVSGIGFRYPLKFIVSKLFSKIHENAAAFLRHPVEKCVITFPHTQPSGLFDTKRKNVLTNSAEMAGFTQVTLMEAHTAAALTAQHLKGVWNVPKSVLYLEFSDKLWKYFSVEGSRASFNYIGWSYLKGEFRLRTTLMKYSIQKFSESENITQNVIFSETSEGKIRSLRLFEICKQAVKSLSNVENAIILVPEFFHEKNLAVNVSRNEFETLNAVYFNQIPQFITDALRNIGKTKDNVEFIIVGEDSVVPKVKQVLDNYFSGEEIEISGVRPEEIVAYGAAVKGAMIAANAITANNMFLYAISQRKFTSVT